MTRVFFMVMGMLFIVVVGKNAFLRPPISAPFQTRRKTSECTPKVSDAGKDG
jgi:hypothetical protein